VCFAAVFVLWDIKAVFYTLWRPLEWLVGYADPRKQGPQDRLHGACARTPAMAACAAPHGMRLPPASPATTNPAPGMLQLLLPRLLPPLPCARRAHTPHTTTEWYFRSGLDRYVWIWGMVCAYVHPQATALLSRLEELPPARRASVRAGILAGVGGVLAVYYHTVYCLPKLQYNKVGGWVCRVVAQRGASLLGEAANALHTARPAPIAHDRTPPAPLQVHPYTSWIPLTLWVVVRNLTPPLRTWSARLYGWLGCITLETYLCQFHIWLHSGLPDGQPKYLLCLIPGYPLLNFAAVSARECARRCMAGRRRACVRAWWWWWGGWGGGGAAGPGGQGGRLLAARRMP
jgi:hypothetical protein